jgi:membrane-associated phospholipid phosphatase
MPRNVPRIGLSCVLVLSWLGTVGGNVVAAAPDEPSRTTTAVAAFPRELWHDARALPSTENAWWLLGGAGLALAAYQIEDPDGATRFLDRGAIDNAVDFGNTWGDVRVQAPLALSTWAIGSVAGKAEMAQLGFDLSRGLLLSYGTVSALKVAFDRTRPNGDAYSFPSGHTASAFTTAGVVSRRYGGWAGGVTIGLGVLTGLGRMEDMKHFASDVVVGATIGWIIGRNAGRPRAGDGIALQLVPLPSGIAVAGRW